MPAHEYMIIQIPPTETYAVRSVVLRPGKSWESCKFVGDDLSTTRHFGIYRRNELCGIISLFAQNNLIFDSNRQLQVRGMAVLSEYRQFGLGTLLMQNAEAIALKDRTEIIWFNARESAVGFYKKLGYIIVGDSFEIIDIGTHVVMYKRV